LRVKEDEAGSPASPANFAISPPPQSEISLLLKIDLSSPAEVFFFTSQLSFAAFYFFVWHFFSFSYFSTYYHPPVSGV
jgi:hypothetical protein